jgi:hypothetical protein
MQRFRLFVESYLTEAKQVVGIQHIEHPSDRTFDGHKAAKHALNTLRGVAMGRTRLSRKIDDKMSFKLMRDEHGRVGAAYKGSGSSYNFSNDDIERQHAAKPYLIAPLKAILAHAHKVLPNRVGEYQGGFMSTPETRTEKGGKIGHTPNTITYSVKKDSPEGKKLSGSKVSLTIHTELKGPKRKATPIEDQSEFASHPDVHLVDHSVSAEQRKIEPTAKKTAIAHLSAAEKLMQDHDYGHLSGHEAHLRTYVNSTVDSDEKPNLEGYKAHLQKRWQKEIDKVKTEKAKKAKAEQRDQQLTHVDRNKEAFDRSFQIHHHLQTATNILADSLNNTAHGGVETEIAGKKSGGEGFVAKGLKIINRKEFSKANREHSALLKAKK